VRPVVEGDRDSCGSGQGSRKGKAVRGVWIDRCQHVAKHPPIIAQRARAPRPGLLETVRR
jgi:hypothetical protein